MKFLLDTDTVSYWLRGEGGVVDALKTQRRAEIAISAVTASELELGVARRRSRKLRRIVRDLLTEMPVAPYDLAAARAYGRLANLLLRRGTPIGMADTMIAAHALSLNVTLVTHNTRHFRRVRGLRVEDWY
jgi:tRNA(fMet)-specific endonuclease VapC